MLKYWILTKNFESAKAYAESKGWTREKWRQLNNANQIIGHILGLEVHVLGNPKREWRRFIIHQASMRGLKIIQGKNEELSNATETNNRFAA